MRNLLIRNDKSLRICKEIEKIKQKKKHSIENDFLIHLCKQSYLYMNVQFEF